MTDIFFRLWNDNSGATAIEYALLAAGIALAVISTVNTLGNTVLTTQFQKVSNSLTP